MRVVAFTVPGPPQGKARPRMTRQGHAYTPEKTRNYEALVKLAASEAMRGRPLLDGAIEATIYAIFPIPASWSRKKREAALLGYERPTVKPDADNIAKVLDGINGIVFADDKQITRLTVAKVYGEGPGVDFELREIGEAR